MGKKVPRKDFQVNIKFKIKKLPAPEYGAIALTWKTVMENFNHTLKEHLANDRITIETLAKLTKSFRFAEIEAIDLTGIEMIEPPRVPSVTPEVQPTPITPTATPSLPSVETIPQTTPIAKDISPPTPASTQVQPTQPEIGGTAETIPQQTPPSQPQPIAAEPEKETGDLGFSVSVRPSIPSSKIPSASESAGSSEEDRATGVAVLRKQMLEELRRIRTIATEADLDVE